MTSVAQKIDRDARIAFSAAGSGLAAGAGEFAGPTSSASRGEGETPMTAPQSSATTATGSAPARAGSAPAARPNALLEAALEYAAKGWPVFPLRPYVKGGDPEKDTGKAPATTHGFKEATTDPSQIKAWWASNPCFNVGIYCGGADLFIADLDIKPNKETGLPQDGISNWQMLAKMHGFPAGGTLTSLTPSGGRHLVFQMPAERLSISSNKAGPGIDGRGDGGYIAAPPSIIDGVEYRWEDENAPILPMPAAAAALFAKKQQKKKPSPLVRTAATTARLAPIQAGAAVAAGAYTNVPLLDLVQADGFAQEAYSNQHQGGCPWCGGTKRFRVAHNSDKIQRDGTRDYWACRECHEEAGDKVAWLVDYRGMSVVEAKDACGIEVDPQYRPYSKPFPPLSGETPAAAGEDAATGALGENETGDPQPHPWVEHRTTFEHFATTKPDPPVWMVPGLIETESLAVVYGSPGSLKSMIIADLAVAVASGGGWLPGLPGINAPPVRDTPQRKVLWIDLDNGRKRSHERMHAFAKGRGIATADLAYYAFPPLDLASEESSALLVDLIRWENADLVIIDTFINATSVKNENDNAELRAPLFRLRKIVDALRCTIILIHHSNKAAGDGAKQRNMRGGTALAGALDLQLEVTRPDQKGDLITITAVKERSAPVPKITARWTFDHDLAGAMESCRFFAADPGAAAGEDREEDRSEEIIELLRSGGATSARQVRAQVKGRGEAALETIKRLVSTGRILETPRTGKGGGMILSLPAPRPAPEAQVDPRKLWEFLEKVGARTLPKIAQHFGAAEAAVEAAVGTLGHGLPDGKKVTSKSSARGRRYTAVSGQVAP